MNKKEDNYAFIDGQNLYLGTKQENWSIDYKKLKIYLKDKYKINLIFYFWGYYLKENEPMYKKLRSLNYKLIFKEHNPRLISKKKGNIDSNLVFEIMKKLSSKKSTGKVVLISGDGDYKKLVNYLINKSRFQKILFPNKKFASSLYKNFGSEFFDYMKNFKEHINEKGS